MSSATLATVSSIEDLQSFIKSEPHVKVTGGGSKGALSRGANLSLKGLTGVLEYDPAEYTFTALAGTPVREVTDLLAQHGQYLPFDPPLAGEGATLGGTVASGLSGSGRFRYGGVRDFLLAVRFVNGKGEVVTGGAKVVKNAAGFDLPKLLVGSLGRFGIMAELTFKVFPKPETYRTLVLTLPSLTDALNAMTKLAMSGAELHALDLLPPNRLMMRLGGQMEALEGRLERLQSTLGYSGAVLEGEKDAQAWRYAGSLEWLPPQHGLVKIPLNPQKLERLETSLNAQDVTRRYSVGGNVAYVAFPDGQGVMLEFILKRLGLTALAITGDWASVLLNSQKNPFEERFLEVLDPERKFS